jgi:uncharacterized protein
LVVNYIRMKLLILFLIVFYSITCILTPAQSIEAIRSNYTKYEYEIPMRDGVKLFTAVYVPKDKSLSYPIMLTRTPYGVPPYGVDNYRTSLGPSESFTKDGFIFAYQDVRGRFMSEGKWQEVRPIIPVKNNLSDVDESTDAYDTIDWLIKNIKNNNGKVGLWGISYPGFYTVAGIINAHPALKAASPQAPIGDCFMGDDCYHNGAFFLAANFGFYSRFVEHKDNPDVPDARNQFNYKTPDGYDFFLRMGPISNANTLYFKGENPYWNKILEHGTYDEFWKKRAIANHLKNVKPAVLTVGGWFDAEDLAGPLNVYRSNEQNSPGSVNMLVMGPWTHGSWAYGDGNRVGNLDFASKTALFYREKIEFPFFSYYLKGKEHIKLPEAYVFETGTNQWRTFDSWVPEQGMKKTLYLGSRGNLLFEPTAKPEDKGFDEYLSDPNKPVPYLGYIAMGMTRDYMTEDQRFASQRSDVLTYKTEPLLEDITVVGPIEVKLYVSTSGTDSDFVVKLIDVYPGNYPNTTSSSTTSQTTSSQSISQPINAVKMGGYEQLVRGEPFRGKFRNSVEKAEPFEPGKVEKIEFKMPDICHTFRKGHRIMVQIQSSWFPLVDRNPQKFIEIAKAKEEDFQKAVQRIYRSRGKESIISITVIPY